MIKEGLLPINKHGERAERVASRDLPRRLFRFFSQLKFDYNGNVRTVLRMIEYNERPDSERAADVIQRVARRDRHLVTKPSLSKQDPPTPRRTSPDVRSPPAPSLTNQESPLEGHRKQRRLQHYNSLPVFFLPLIHPSPWPSPPLPPPFPFSSLFLFPSFSFTS